MKPDVHEPIGTTEPLCADRIGFAKLTTMAFGGTDLRPLRDELLAKVAGGTADAGEGLDLSLITQLLGDKQMGLAIQGEVLAFHQLFRSPCAAEKPKLRVLALAAAIDMGGNTPIEFLLASSGIELLTLYVVAGVGLPASLPDRDVPMACRTAGAALRPFRLRRLREWGRLVSQLPSRVRRRPGFRMRYGDRRSRGYPVSQRRHVQQCRQAPPRRNLHAHFRHRLRP